MTPEEIKAEQERLTGARGWRPMVAGHGEERFRGRTHEERAAAAAEGLERTRAREERRREATNARNRTKRAARRDEREQALAAQGHPSKLVLLVEGPKPAAPGDRFSARMVGSDLLRTYRYRPEIHELAAS